jgi:hypothetical protein
MLRISSNKTDKRIAVDFDGVLHSYTTWDGDVPKNNPIDGAREFIDELVDREFEVVVFSSRAKNKTGINGIKEWLKRHEFPSLKIYHEKPPAELYIDDRGYRFEGNFDDVLNFIQDGMNPWYKE